MTVSMRVMSAGDGYKYLLKTIAAADGDRSLSTPLTRYYAEAGTPPGRWLGAGVGALGHGEGRGAAGPAENDPHAVTNPRLVVEVTSRSTEDYDRGEKLSHYKQLPGLEAVLIASHRRPQLTLLQRDGDSWVTRELRPGESASLAGLTLGVDEVYAGLSTG